MDKRTFRFGVVSIGAQSQATWTGLARRAEELGYASLLMPDRPSMGGLAPFPALAVAAAATSSLHVGSYVFANDYRYPILLAREAATLQLLSEGRFEFGLGAGVAPEDFEHMGMPLFSTAERVGRLEEAVQLVKQLWTKERVDFAGKHYTITSTPGQRSPFQQPPLLIAAAGKRMLGLAGREADIVAIGSRVSGGRPDPSDATLEQKLAWLREAAGERFASIELAMTIYYIGVSDGPISAPSPAGGPQFPKQQMSSDQVIEHLQEQRERYGFTYFQVYEGQMENFASVVARLVGK